MFRTVSQISINYRAGPLSNGNAGGVHGGDRLPWVAADGTDNYVPLSAMTWQVHVYGSASADLVSWCTRHDIPLHTFAWGQDHGNAGLVRDALYLLRPDTYVAFAGASGDPVVLDRYFADHGIQPGQKATGVPRGRGPGALQSGGEIGENRRSRSG
jgi:hypothetical protein